MFRIPYMAAVAEVRNQLKNIPTVSKDGVEWIEYNGRQFPMDWFVRHVARLVLDGCEAATRRNGRRPNRVSITVSVMKEVV